MSQTIHLMPEFCGVDATSNRGIQAEVDEQSFQAPMPNLPFLLNYLWLSARFLRESRLTTQNSHFR